MDDRSYEHLAFGKSLDSYTKFLPLFYNVEGVKPSELNPYIGGEMSPSAEGVDKTG